MKKKSKKRWQRFIALVLVTVLMWQTDSMRYFITAYASETETVGKAQCGAEGTAENAGTELINGDIYVIL